MIPGWASRESEPPMTTVSLGAVKPDHIYLYLPQGQPARLGCWLKISCSQGQPARLSDSLIGLTIGGRVQQKSSPRKLIHQNTFPAWP